MSLVALPVKHGFDLVFFSYLAHFFTSFSTILNVSQMNVVFWDLVSLEAHTKNISNLKFLTACGDLCAVVVCERSRNANTGASNSANTAAGAKNATGNNKKGSKGGDSDDELPALSTKATPAAPSPTVNTDVYTIQLRNAIGAVVDTKVLPFVPKYVSMSAYHVVCANDRTVYAWHFQSQAVRSGLANSATTAITSTTGLNATAGESNESSEVRSHTSKVRMFDIANTSFTTAQSPETFQIISEAVADPIVATTISDKFLVIGRKNGSITRFNLPHLTPENTYTVADREPARLALNCSSSKLGFVDSNGLFSILDLEARVTEADQESRETSRYVLGPYFGKRVAAVERKDVWDMRWSEDDADMIVGEGFALLFHILCDLCRATFQHKLPPSIFQRLHLLTYFNPISLFTVMEKTKMVVFNGETAEEPVVSSAYLGRFKDLEVRVVALDTLMMHPDKISR